MDLNLNANDKEYIQQLVNTYKKDVDALASYIPWLEEKLGAEVQQSFNNPDIIATSVPFPIYDSTMMSFIQTARNTMFMNENYVYTLTRNKLRSSEDEILFVDECKTLKDMPALGDLVAKYVLGGATKSRLWSEGVKNGVLLAAITQMRDVLHFYQ